MTGGLRLAGIAAGAALIAFFGLAGRGPAQPGFGQDRTDGACTLFEHAEFAGVRRAIAEGDTPWVGEAWNDRISSIQCRPQCVATGYQDIDFGGPSSRFAGEVRFVGPAWNDRISALRVSCRGDRPGRGRDGPPRICTYFEDADFRGRRGRAGEGQVVAWIGLEWNDRISSIECHPDCTLEGSEHIDHGGERQRFPGRTPFVGPAWNDRISALRVICRPERGGRIH